MSVDVRVRNATPSDADEIARVHVDSWRVAYRGLMPSAALAALNVGKRAASWRAMLLAIEQGGEHPFLAPRQRAIVAVDRDRPGRLLGWATFGGAREADAPADGELHGLYADPAAFSTGVGRALMLAVIAGLEAEGYERAMLWVLEGNERAAAFYERFGWRLDGGRKLDTTIVPDHALVELRRVRALRSDLASTTDSD